MISSAICHGLSTEEEKEDKCGTVYRYWFALGVNVYFTLAQIVMIVVFYCVLCQTVERQIVLHWMDWRWQLMKWFSLIESVPVGWLIVTIIALKADSELARTSPYMWAALVFYVFIFALRISIFVQIPLNFNDEYVVRSIEGDEGEENQTVKGRPLEAAAFVSSGTGGETDLDLG